MSDKKISQLTALTGANVAADDVLAIVDTNATETKKIRADELFKSLSAGTALLPAIAPAADQNTGIFFPAADTIAFSEGGVESMRITSSGNVLIGKTSATANGGDLQVSKGITFPATQSAQSDANTLDDYEEGTWTPTYSQGVTSPTYADTSGYYKKIGGLVFITGRIALSGGTAAATRLKIGGLPFTVGTGTGIQGAISIGYQGNFKSDGALTLLTAGNTTNIDFWNLGGTDFLGTSATNISGAIHFSGCYQVV